MIESVFQSLSKTAQRVTLLICIALCWGLAALVFHLSTLQSQPNPGFLFSFGFAGGGLIFAQALIHHLWYGWV